jgi:GWxTD domain-containing protein
LGGRCRAAAAAPRRPVTNRGPRRPRAAAGLRRGLAAALAAAQLLAAGAAAAAPRPAKSYREWARGPVRWLMLPEEERAFRRLRDDDEAARFVAEFWRRRDPDPERPETNPFHDRFEQRVAAADRLYAEGDTRGSLTDRGHALVLLGAPPRLRVGQQTAPAWSPRRSGRAPGYAVEQVRVEVWEYDREALWPQLAVLLEREGHQELVLTFLIESGRATLVEGDRLLELAALASVRPGGDVLVEGVVPTPSPRE